MEEETQESEQYNFEEDYESLKKQHNLPDFEALAQDFDIEKIADKEPLFLAREIRRIINEKITAYIHLFETLINPTAPPMFVFKILKNMTEEEKKEIQEFYKVLSKAQIEIMKLDTIYKEEDEIKFINDNFKIWQEMKSKIHTLFESFQTNFENGNIEKERSYFD
ncbi:hypothetical protein HN903_03000 [archaeon]|jgi:hypothetical protein|nr:hypothetical protein [archaeon]MBT7128699.1 hypothetical protein [archaeon]